MTGCLPEPKRLMACAAAALLVLNFATTTRTAGAQDRVPFVAVVKSVRAQLMSRGGKNYVALADARKGDLVIVRARGGAKKAWYAVNYSKPLLAYITTRFVKKLKDDQGVVEANRVSLRPTASLERIPITQLKIGTKLRIFGEKNGFYEVMIPQETLVWIRSSDVRPIGPLSKYTKRLREEWTNSLASFRGVAGKSSASPLAKASTPSAKTAGVPTARGNAAPSVRKSGNGAKGVAANGGAAKRGAAKSGVNPAGPVASAKSATPNPATPRSPGNPALNLPRIDPKAAARNDLMERLKIVQTRFEAIRIKNQVNPLKAVLLDLGRLDDSAAKIDFGYGRFKVNQLVTKVRLAITELETIERTKRDVVRNMRPLKGVITQAGWLRKETKLLSKRPLYKLEKGNVTFYYLTTKKYDLEKYVNKHVAVKGEILPRKGLLENTFLEVARLKVLSQ